jgi:hypothetical protein
MSYYNTEDDSTIICPYCGESYEPTYEDTWIGDDCADCYTEEVQTFTCEKCGKRFTMYGYQAGWAYHTETIDGEMTEEEYEDFQDKQWEESLQSVRSKTGPKVW